MIKQFFGLLIIFALTTCFSGSANAHDVFQDVLKETYTLKSFSCKTCHQDSDNRKLRTPFAERIYQEMKDKNYSEKFAAAVKADEAAAKAKGIDKLAKGEGEVPKFEKIVAEDFKESFKKVAVQKISFDEMIKQGLFNGARLDTKKIAAKKEAAEAAKKEEGKKP